MNAKDVKCIHDRCHIDTNQDGDRFVGVKADANDAIIYFPIGYELPEDDSQIRTDIRNLFFVLSEFSKEDRVIQKRQHQVNQSVEFPIHAYLEIINNYLSFGYYKEKEKMFETAARGTIDWPKTVRNQVGIPNGRSLVYTKFTIRTNTKNEDNEITKINKYCVYESFEKLGWIYIPNMPEQPGQRLDKKASISILNDKISNTNLENIRKLYIAMRDMLEYMDERTSDKQFYFGTDDFETVWERLIDRVFGIKNKDDYFPHTKWFLDYGTDRTKKPLQPDSIMIYGGKYYVLDAKYYKYGVTGNSDDLPDSSSISKQITYGEYLQKKKNLPDLSLFNAFIMPYNKKDNFFGCSSNMSNIGEAVGVWKDNTKNFERIQGIVLDTRYLLFNYASGSEECKRDLATCIETISKRPPVQDFDN